MKTKEQAEKQVEHILQRLAKRLDAKLFLVRAKRIARFVHDTWGQWNSQ